MLQSSSCAFPQRRLSRVQQYQSSVERSYRVSSLTGMGRAVGVGIEVCLARRMSSNRST